jgi:hypothetical protein
MEKDAETIANYRNPTYVLAGWTPKMAPLILSQPQSATAKAGQTAAFHIKVAAVPDASYQWFKNKKPIRGATSAALVIENALASDAAAYTVTVKNGSGSVSSRQAMLRVE